MKYLNLLILTVVGFSFIGCSNNEDNPSFPLKFKFQKYQIENPHLYVVKDGGLYEEILPTGTFKELVDDNTNLTKEELDASTSTTELILLSDSLLSTTDDEGKKDSTNYYIDNGRIITPKWPNFLLYDRVNNQIDNHFSFNSYILHNKNHIINLDINRTNSTDLTKVVNQTIAQYNLSQNDTCFVQQFKAIYLN